MPEPTKGFAQTSRRLVDRQFLGEFITDYERKVIDPLVDHINAQHQDRTILYNSLSAFAFHIHEQANATHEQVLALDRLWVVRFERFVRRQLQRLRRPAKEPTNEEA